MAKPNLSSLSLRVLTATVGLPLLVGVCLWGRLPFALFTVLLALLARSELQRAYARCAIHPNALLSLLGPLAPVLVYLLHTSPTRVFSPLPVFLVLACGLVVASLWETGVASHSRPIQPGKNLAYGLLCGAYVSLFGGITLLRLSAWQGSQGAFPQLDGGARLVLLTLACTMTGDSAAYFVGRLLGHHKLAEGLSPKKTTEGLLGGAVGSLLVGSGMGALLLGAPLFGLAVGALAGLLGPLGDLFKSALKREIGVKDFGALLPGHGGVLDRFDSLLFTAPLVVLIVLTVSR